LKPYRLSSVSDFRTKNDYLDNVFFETVFLDETILKHAIDFYNSYMGYREHPIDREEAFLYAKLGTRINAEVFRLLHPKNENELDMFYKLSNFHFFNNIIRFMDGMHRNIASDFLGRVKGPILDMGGGTGGFSLYFASKGFDVTFVESNLMCLTWMRYISRCLNLNINIVESGQEIKGKFKFIIAKDIMEHVVNPDKFKDYLVSLIDTGGSIYMTHFPCCGPDEFAPMHFKLDLEDKNNPESKFIFSESDNLEYLRSGQYPTKPSNPLPVA